MHYFGGKGGAGVYQQIINLMPAHEVYIETHLGGGNILVRKRPARSTIAIEIDTRVLQSFQQNHDFGSAVTYVNGDCIDYLRNYRWTGKELIYADPPYLMSTRRSNRSRYTYEYTESDHKLLLSTLLEVPADVMMMISGYPNSFYDALLEKWHTHTFTAPTRRGPATEKLWMNFDPFRLLKHEYTFAGGNFRERERIKRKADRWVSNLARLPEGERNFILDRLSSAFMVEYSYHCSANPARPRGHTFGDDGEDLHDVACSLGTSSDATRSLFDDVRRIPTPSTEMRDRLESK